MTARRAAPLILAAMATTGALTGGLPEHDPSRLGPTAATTVLASATSAVTPSGPGAPFLRSIFFFDPRSGYGAFSTGSTSACRIEVATTSDGGAQFHDPVHVTSCGTFGDPSLAFDDHGDGFLYSSTADVLYATHDGGSTWSPAVEKGRILSVEAVGYSVWMLTVECPEASPLTTTARCRLSVRESADGGRAWRTSPGQPEVASRFPAPSAGGGSLVRLSRSAAYVEGGPNGYRPGGPSTVPLWYTGDGGAVWSFHELPCGIGTGAGAVSLSAAPTGMLYAACGSEPAAGNQLKSVVVSHDGGLTWSHPGVCAVIVDHWCATKGITIGYLGQIEAVSATRAYMSGPRSPIRVTADGGTTWKDDGPYSTDVSNVVFFGPSVGIACGLWPKNFASAVWHTDDGGASWTLVTPVVSRS